MVTTTVSVLVAPLLSVTVSVTVCVPTPSVVVNTAPVPSVTAPTRHSNRVMVPSDRTSQCYSRDRLDAIEVAVVHRGYVRRPW